MKEKIINFIKEPFLYVMIICILFQWGTYHQTKEEYMITNDSYSYINDDSNILKGEISSIRTPVYPLMIKVIKRIGGETNLYLNIIIIQKVIGILGVAIFYFALKTITKSKWIYGIGTLLFGCCSYIFLWNHSILTESISIFEMILLALLTLLHLKKTRISTAILIPILVWIMIMTRPAFLYLLPIYLIFWAIRFFSKKEERKVTMVGILSSIACILLLLVYCGMMQKQHNTYALTVISSDNKLLNVLDSQNYKYAENEEMKDIVNTVLEEDTSEFALWQIKSEFSQKYSQEEINSFIKDSIKGNMGQYANYMINKTIYMSQQSIGAIYCPMQMIEKNNIITPSYQMGDISYLFMPFNFAHIYIIIVAGIIILLYQLIKNKKLNYVLAFFITTIAANLLTLIVGAPFEYQRLFVCSLIFIWLLFGYVTEELRILINKKK